MDDRRRFPRFPIKLEISNDDNSLCLITKDVSRKGLFAETKDPLPIGSIIHLHCNFAKGQKPITFDGEVKHHGSVRKGMGIMIFNMEKNSIENLCQFRKIFYRDITQLSGKLRKWELDEM